MDLDLDRVGGVAVAFVSATVFHITSTGSQTCPLWRKPSDSCPVKLSHGSSVDCNPGIRTLCLCSAIRSLPCPRSLVAKEQLQTLGSCFRNWIPGSCVPPKPMTPPPPLKVSAACSLCQPSAVIALTAFF